jgi:hypothetical protein
MQMVVTTAAVTEKVRMSRRLKAELVIYEICKQPLPRFTHLLPLKPDVCPVYPESF